ncbi:hypothetical protein BDR26DRAFT_857106 [Obelidium mucronatum]|nr:hypothetical protein BDR26DRAFT_857106 [Obelidium mucronatum]
MPSSMPPSTPSPSSSSSSALSALPVDMPKIPHSQALIASDPRFAHLPKLKSHITSWHWIFGPCPPPPDHVYQHWLNFYSVIIPESVSNQMEYHELKDIKEEAVNNGIICRLYVSFDCPIEFSLIDLDTGIPIFKDTRPRFDLQFTSPHYSPWDDVLEPYTPAFGVEMGSGNPKNGSSSFWKPELRPEEWRLKWDWKVCDVDYLLYQPIGQSVNLWGSSKRKES